MRLAGVDFTSSPSRRKPITVAHGRLAGSRLEVDGVDELVAHAAFEQWLREPGPWLGAFDFPFGLPRDFVAGNDLGASCAEIIAGVHARCPTRMAWRGFIDAWGNGRAAGTRLLHRATDLAGGIASTSPLQTRYVPVGFMYYEGVRRLVDADVTLPGLHAGDPQRLALEGYPRRLAHALIERRSYKNSEAADRRAARDEIVAALEADRLGFRFTLDVGGGLRDRLVDDASGDRLDAVLCLVQAARASRLPRFGLPATVDPVEGWIAG